MDGTEEGMALAKEARLTLKRKREAIRGNAGAGEEGEQRKPVVIVGGDASKACTHDVALPEVSPRLLWLLGRGGAPRGRCRPRHPVKPLGGRGPRGRLPPPRPSSHIPAGTPATTPGHPPVQAWEEPGPSGREGFPRAEGVEYGTVHYPAYTGPPAKTYPYDLDPFQTTSVACLERRESVMVAAHTSAGKTTVAEYAIAMAFRDNQKVIYTSPLKALSNQKFRELQEEFGDVGLMTGDVTINPNSSCLVMTTEILRSMLYRGAELLREMAWVVFDEVHYMQDKERGVVWEETIIFLPPAVKMVFLSATLSNSREFCEWVTHLRGQPTHVVYTEYRPTPLQHYAFPSGGSGLFLVKDERGDFKDRNFDELRRQFGARDGGEGAAAGVAGAGRKVEGRRGRGDDSTGAEVKERRDRPRRNPQDVVADLTRLLGLVKSKSLDPCIVFSFSRRECEKYAMAAQKLSFNTDAEAEAVQEVFDSAMQCLKEEDRALPAIAHILPLLRRGVGIHHSGLLPILKELIEILFQEQLIKVLFATETFAMGVNMPARTVIFTAVQKFDGEATRFLGSGECIQMSGRAGRRGKDDRGVVILMVDDTLGREDLKAMIAGTPAPLVSSFKLSYYTLLNLIRRSEGSGQNLEYVIKRSFSQFQHERALREKGRELERLGRELAASDAEWEREVAEADPAAWERVQRRVALERELRGVRGRVSERLRDPTRCLRFLKAGRLVRVGRGADDFGWGVVLEVLQQKGRGGPAGERSADPRDYVVDVLLECAAGDAAAGGAPRPPRGEEPRAMRAVPVRLPLVTSVSKLRVTLPADLKSGVAMGQVSRTIETVVSSRGGPDKVPRLGLVAEYGCSDDEAGALEAREAELERELAGAEGGQGDAAVIERVRGSLEKRADLQEQEAELRRAVKRSMLHNFRAEAKQRLAVLAKLGHVDEDGVVTLKGRAACEVDTADELVASELMFNGAFSSLDRHQLGALAACLVPVEKTQDQIQLSRALAPSLVQLQDTAKRIGEVSKDAKLDVDVEKYVEGFRPTLMDVVYAWSKGAPFADVCKMTEMFEGSVIRAVRRLHELLTQLQMAGEAVGDTDLANKFKDAADSLHRDIMFAASLYI